MKGEGNLVLSSNNVGRTQPQVTQPAAIPGVASTAKEAPLGAGRINFMMLTRQSISVECSADSSLEQLKGYLAEQLECSSEEILLIAHKKRLRTSNDFKDANLLATSESYYPTIVFGNSIKKYSSYLEELFTKDQCDDLKNLAMECARQQSNLYNSNETSNLIPAADSLLNEVASLVDNSKCDFTYEQLHDALALRLNQLKVIKNEAVQVDNELDND